MAKKPQPRECQPCTACCDGWVSMNINGQEVYPGKPCIHSTKQGCNAYDDRPVDPCINFECGWVTEDSPLPDWMKPDNAKVLVVFNKLQWRDLPVDLAVPVGKRIPPRALKWLLQFAEKNMRPLIYTEQTVENGEYSRQQMMTGYGPPEFQQEVSQWTQSGKSFW